MNKIKFKTFYKNNLASMAMALFIGITSLSAFASNEYEYSHKLNTCQSSANSIPSPSKRNLVLSKCFMRFKNEMSHFQCLSLASDYIGLSARSSAISQCSMIESSLTECRSAANSYHSVPRRENALMKCVLKYSLDDDEHLDDNSTNNPVDTFNPDDIDLGDY